MKKSLCFYFQIHLPYQLRRYRFFDISKSHHYYDDFNIRSLLMRTAEECYLPMNKVLLDIIKEQGSKFKVTFSVTGEAIEQMEKYTPHVLDSFKELAATGCVEFLSETYSHSLVFLKDEKEFERQLLKQSETIEKYFGQKPKAVRLTGLIYSDQIGERVSRMGFDTMLTEGAKHVMGWKSPNYVYNNTNDAKLKVLLRNYGLSDPIAYRFSDRTWKEWPLTCEKYLTWLDAVNENEEVINLFMDYQTFGVRHHQSSGIFEFMRYLPERILATNKYEFLTPSEIVEKHQAVGPVHVPYPISWSEEERDLSIWLGNEMQNDAFGSLCELADKIRFVGDDNLVKDWEYLQDSDHFYSMCTKWMTEGTKSRFKTFYSSPYDAYINFMNILSDLIIRVNDEVDKKVASLMKNKVAAEKIAKIIPVGHTNYTSVELIKIIDVVGDTLKTKATKTKVVESGKENTTTTAKKKSAGTTKDSK